MNNTGERLAKIETSLDYLKDKIDSMEKKQDAFICSADKKYASKVVETGFYTLVGVIVLAVIGALIKLVIL